MKKRHYIGTVTLVCSLIISQQTMASYDEESCPWGEEGCFQESLPFLSSANDTRDNLLRLLSENDSVSLPLPHVTQDLTKSRAFSFGFDTAVWRSVVAKIQTPAPASPVSEPLKALGLEALAARYAKKDSALLETRFVSMTPESDARFFNALLADDSLSPEQRQILAKTKMDLSGSAEAQTAITALSFPADSSAQQFKRYLLAASHFYAGQYEQSRQLWLSLKDISQPWLSETSSYMLMRNALNKSSQNAKGEFGYFEVEKIDRNAALEALQWADNYLQRWPEGQYANSASGLKRRINWYLQNWDALATFYEQTLTQNNAPDVLVALIAETDAKLLSNVMAWDATFFRKASDAPLLTFIQTLRLMRNIECNGKQLCIDEDYLTGIKPIFASERAQAYWTYLALMLKYLQQDYPTVIAQIEPMTTLAQNDILAFSRQVLYGKALMATEQWEKAYKHWSALLSASQNLEQQQFLQTELAATLLLSNQTAAIFAKNSPVTNLKYRSVILKTYATAELLRQQVINGPNDEERTIALHTLLMRDLISGHYAEWLTDKGLITHIAHPASGENFADVDLKLFDWSGNNTEKGYFCRSLEKTVTELTHNVTDSHALNCLGEFIRDTDAEINLEQDRYGNAELTSVIFASNKNTIQTQPVRQAYYEAVIMNPKSEPEDKSYALYRAIMCYAPSGSNDCGGEEVDKLTRKAWFTELKTEYPGSPWAEKLRYYW